MVKHKKIEPLVNEELIRKVEELGDLNRAEKAKACGYYTTTKNGIERVNMVRFLNALVDAKGIESNENGKAIDSCLVSVQSANSTSSNQIVKVNRIDKPTDKPRPVVQPLRQQEAQIEPVLQMETEQLEGLKPVFQLESLAEPIQQESIYDSGWSLAQLINEFRR